jgi:hypothetical protein
MENWAIIIPALIILLLIINLPITYNWVSKRIKYQDRLNSIGFEEDNEGLIRRAEGVKGSNEVFFGSDSGSSSNPGAGYTAARSQVGLILINSIISLYYYIVFKRRIRRQRRIYNQGQLKLIEQIENNDVDCFHLKDAFIKNFSSPAATQG